MFIPTFYQIRVYPNPTTDYIQVGLPASLQKVSLKLIDMSGRLVLAQKIAHQEPVDISFLPQGVYGFRVMSQKGDLIGAGKIVKD